MSGWPSVPVSRSKAWAQNLHGVPLPGPVREYGLSGARKIFIDLGSGAPKTSIFDEKSVKVTFSRCYAGFHPTFWAAGPLTSKNHQGVRSRPAVREYGGNDGESF